MTLATKPQKKLKPDEATPQESAPQPEPKPCHVCGNLPLPAEDVATGG